MNRSIRGMSAALATMAILLSSVGTAGAATKDLEDHGKVNIVFDAIILRPLGLGVTALGGALFAFPVGPMVALTRWQDIEKPLDFLVLRPARYTFADPLGHH